MTQGNSGLSVYESAVCHTTTQTFPNAVSVVISKTLLESTKRSFLSKRSTFDDKVSVQRSMTKLFGKGLCLLSEAAFYHTLRLFIRRLFISHRPEG